MIADLKAWWEEEIRPLALERGWLFTSGFLVFYARLIILLVAILIGITVGFFWLFVGPGGPKA